MIAFFESHFRHCVLLGGLKVLGYYNDTRQTEQTEQTEKNWEDQKEARQIVVHDTGQKTK